MNAFLLIAVLIASACASDVLFIAYRGDWTCQWPTERHNITLPYCFTAEELSVEQTPDHQLLWKEYGPPYSRCNSQVEFKFLSSFDTCTNVANPGWGYYKAHSRGNASFPVLDASSMPTNINITYYETNDCAGQPSAHETITMHQCHADVAYHAFAFQGFRKNGTEDVLVAEFWDSNQSCNGVNAGWAYLHNGACSQTLFECRYRSWIAFW